MNEATACFVVVQFVKSHFRRKLQVTFSFKTQDIRSLIFRTNALLRVVEALISNLRDDDSSVDRS